jgi:2-polyprenyl-3-methyl-5-hydroxy-6-metoxy-1,4-benzoquinol methylase
VTRSQAEWLEDVELVEMIQAVTEETASAVRRRLREERRHLGLNVRRDFATRGLAPHHWSPGVEAFYAESPALIYELAVSNESAIKNSMRERIGALLAEPGEPLRVLCFGDGCGYDSLFLARLGHRVTYADVPGLPSRFARQLFARAGASVDMALAGSALPASSFDAVVCLDVLEHCPDPPGAVADLARCLAPGGVLLSTSPFFSVVPDFPGHLAANARYSGSIRELYGRNGLRLHHGSWLWSPLVLAKGDGVSWMTPGSAARRAVLRIVGLALSTARVSTLPFRLPPALDRTCRSLTVHAPRD